MGEHLLDASAVLALLNQEPGHDQVRAVVQASVLGSVNLCEVFGKLIDAGIPAADAREAVELLGLPIIPFDEELALAAAALQPQTRALGLSLGDRSCLALALNRGARVITAERAWPKLKLGVTIQVLR